MLRRQSQPCGVEALQKLSYTLTSTPRQTRLAGVSGASGEADCLPPLRAAAGFFLGSAADFTMRRLPPRASALRACASRSHCALSPALTPAHCASSRRAICLQGRKCGFIVKGVKRRSASSYERCSRESRGSERMVTARHHVNTMKDVRASMTGVTCTSTGRAALDVRIPGHHSNIDNEALGALERAYTRAAGKVRASEGVLLRRLGFCSRDAPGSGVRIFLLEGRLQALTEDAEPGPLLVAQAACRRVFIAGEACIRRNTCINMTRWKALGISCEACGPLQGKPLHCRRVRTPH